jgi:site-specific recombinase XerD
MQMQTTYYKEILQDFDTHIVSTKAIKTGNHYTGQAKDFLLYLEQHQVMNLNQVTEKTMKNYFNYLIHRPKKRGTGTLSISSVNDHLSTLRMLSIRMLKEHRLDRSLVVPRNIQVEKNDENPFALTREILTPEEVREVFEACENDLERSLIALAYGSGLRRDVLANLKDLQIDYSKGLVTALKAKNNKTREVPISEFFVKVLRNYSLQRLQLLATTNKREPRFFIDENGLAISGHRLNELLKRIIQRTGNQTIQNKKITLHCLRHSIATHLLDAGETYDYVKKFLGHAFVDTTSLYAKRRKIKTFYTV